MDHESFLFVARTSEACVAALDAIFGAMTFEAISAALNGQEGQWAGVAVPGDAVTDEQALVNGYMKIVEYESGAKLPMVAVPARVNGDRPELRRAPTLGEHTDEVIAALGRTEAQIMELKIAGVIS